jgi:hypothetical protein
MLKVPVPLVPLVSEAAVVDSAEKDDPPFSLTPSTEAGICVAGAAGPLKVAAAAFTVTAQGRLDFTWKEEALELVSPLPYLVTSSNRNEVPVAEVMEMSMAFCRVRVTVWLAVEVDWALAAVKPATRMKARVMIFFMVEYFLVCVFVWLCSYRVKGCAGEVSG